MLLAREQLLIEEGRKEGMAQGMAQGMAESAIKLPYTPFDRHIERVV